MTIEEFKKHTKNYYKDEEATELLFGNPESLRTLLNLEAEILDLPEEKRQKVITMLRIIVDYLKTEE